LLPGLAGQEPSWQLTLQLAAAMDDGEQRRQRLRDAVQLGAPAWAAAWVGALSSDADEQRQGLVDLLFEDPGLARTVPARDLQVPKAVADNSAAARYASFAHGRDVVRRFGAAPIAELLDRLHPSSAPQTSGRPSRASKASGSPSRAPKASGPPSRAPKASGP